MGIAVGGLSTATKGDANGVYGEAASPDGSGVEGLNTATTGDSVGVYGESSSPDGSAVQGFNTNKSGDSTGVYGEVASPDGLALEGVNTSTSGKAVGIEGKSSSAEGFAIVGINEATTGRSIGLYGQSGHADGFGVLCNGNFAASGVKAAVVPFPDGTMRALYCIESPECWFEDYGSAELVEGAARVLLDAGFASTVATSEYYVFLMPEGDCRGLFVAKKDAEGFMVRELQGGRATLRFSYRIVARRKDVEAPRLAVVDFPSRLESNRREPRVRLRKGGRARRRTTTTS